jgi:purine-binding chemotaxis protein CheW
MAESRQYCTFYVNKLYFGVDVKLVQEVIRFQQMTTVPLSQEVISGLINLRGQIVTALDLRRRLDLPPDDDRDELMNVVIRDGDSVVSLLVDEVGDVVEVEDEIFEKPPDTLSGAARELILGAYKLDKRLLLVLDVSQVIQILDAASQREEVA